jgi:FSR family fosmidomycin resistance protein-like MFS transporter
MQRSPLATRPRRAVRPDRPSDQMTAGSASLRTDIRVIGLVSGAHGLSHFYHLTIPPLFPLLRAEFGVSYAALGSVLAVYFGVSGVMQTVAGFLVDRFGARVILMLGLALSAVGIGLVGFAPSFGWLYPAAMIAGFGNCVFHPSDLALLNAKVRPQRLGYAFSVHGIAGNIGWALAPVFAVAISTAWGWRAALVSAGAIGLVYLAMLATQRVLAGGTRAPRREQKAPGSLAEDVRLLASLPIVTCFAFFLLFSMAMVGWQAFSTSALKQIYDIDLVFASSVLTAFLIGGAAGTLAGGVVASRTDRHGAVAVTGMAVSAGVAFVLGMGVVPVPLMVAVAALGGFFAGVLGPSRDILVRQIAPLESRGKVYGFVYSGLDLGGLVAPAVLGWFIDRGSPALVFVATTVFWLCAMPTVLGMSRAAFAGRPAPAG